jgi:hypothetical protein
MRLRGRRTAERDAPAAEITPAPDRHVAMDVARAVGIGTATALGAFLGVGWLGLQVQPAPLPPYPGSTHIEDTVAVPADLPAPVRRFYDAIAGGQVPVITSAVLTGRASLRFAGITFPARWRFTHLAGRDYRHYIEATVFGQPVLKVDESYLDGHTRLELPFGVVEHEPKVDMAANLGLWGESVWLPPVFLTDPRVRWEAIDETTARLVVPFGAAEDSFRVTFDAETGLIKAMQALRYRDAKDERKVPWRLEPLGWQWFHGIRLPSPAAVTWLDQGKPWLVMTLEDVVYNADVSQYIRASGS